jgi:uracil-DNA glycosylase family 4
MIEKERLSGLLADVREHLIYAKELGVELLDVGPGMDVTSEGVAIVAASVQPDALPANAAVPKELPDVPVEVPVSVPKTSVRKPSKLAGLPSLSKIPTMSGKAASTANEIHDLNSASQTSEATRELKPAKAEPSAAEALFGIGKELPKTGETIDDIRADIGDCTRCPLYTGRTQVVHSTGNLQAELMFVGEAPGADEDAQGFPFVGRAGQLLTKIIESIGFKREDVFIGNINRCRPPGNRQPTLPEAHTCRPFLLREIAVVRPKVIVVMGNTAMHNLLDTKVGITKMRGNFQDYFGVKVMPTFHPAFLLRDPHKKREVWEDMKKVRDYLKSAE